MTSSLSGGTNAINLDVVKSSSTLLTSPASSPSSTISDVSQSAIRTKKPRTIRKRPNQTYNEAATLLSEAYPNLFKKPGKFFTKPITTERNNDASSELLLLPLRACDDNDAFSFLLQNKKSTSQTELFSVREKLCSGPGEIISSSGVVNSDELNRDSGEEFDCESIILDEEIVEGIDSIIGSRVGDAGCCGGGGERASPWYGRFGWKFGWARALRHVDGGNWGSFAAVDVREISPGMKNTLPAASVPATEKKKKKKKKANVKVRDWSHAVRLKLNYDDVRNAWSDRGSPFAGM